MCDCEVDDVEGRVAVRSPVRDQRKAVASVAASAWSTAQGAGPLRVALVFAESFMVSRHVVTTDSPSFSVDEVRQARFEPTANLTNSSPAVSGGDAGSMPSPNSMSNCRPPGPVMHVNRLMLDFGCEA